MEFHQHIETSHGEIWIANAMSNGFVKSDNESRQQYEAVFLREMLKAIVGETQLGHESNGAPILKNRPDTCISISHAEEWFAIYLSEQLQAGIDIEIPSNRMERAKKYFLSAKEISLLKPTTEQLQICWGIKECMFKRFRGKVKSMVNDIMIRSIEKNQATATYQNQEVKLKHQQTENFTLVYTI